MGKSHKISGLQPHAPLFTFEDTYTHKVSIAQFSIQISTFGFVKLNEDGKRTQWARKHISHEILEFLGINSRIYERRVFAATVTAATKRQMCYMLWQYGDVALWMSIEDVCACFLG